MTVRFGRIPVQKNWVLQMTDQSKQELASELFSTLENEGPLYYFTQYGSDIDKFVKLGFDREKLEKARESARYLDGISSTLEDMMEEE